MPQVRKTEHHWDCPSEAIHYLKKTCAVAWLSKKNKTWELQEVCVCV